MKKKFGKYISSLLYSGNGSEKSRYNSSGITVVESITSKNTDEPLMKVSELKKPEQINYKRGDLNG